MQSRKKPGSLTIEPLPKSDVPFYEDAKQTSDIAAAKAVESVGSYVNELGAHAAADEYSRPFPSAQRASDKPDYSPALRRVVESIFLVEDEIEATAKRLVAELRIGDARSDYGTVMKRLDEAEDNARAAHRLSVTARAELERFETNARVIESALREKALERLEHDRAAAKAATGKSKDITETDVKATIAQHFADEWSALSSDRGRLKLAIDHLDHQVSNWSSRCKSLQTIASKLR